MDVRLATSLRVDVKKLLFLIAFASFSDFSLVLAAVSAFCKNAAPWSGGVWPSLAHAVVSVQLVAPTASTNFQKLKDLRNPKLHSSKLLKQSPRAS